MKHRQVRFLIASLILAFIVGFSVFLFYGNDRVLTAMSSAGSVGVIVFLIAVLAAGGD